MLEDKSKVEGGLIKGPASWLSHVQAKARPHGDYVYTAPQARQMPEHLARKEVSRALEKSQDKLKKTFRRNVEDEQVQLVRSVMYLGATTAPTPVLKYFEWGRC